MVGAPNGPDRDGEDPGVTESPFAAPGVRAPGRTPTRSAALREPALREATRGLDHRWKTAPTEVIAEGVAAGESTCPDPPATAPRLAALLDGLAVQLTSYPGSVAARSGPGVGGRGAGA